MSVDNVRRGVDRAFDVALEAVATEHRLTTVLRRAADLRSAASGTSRPEHDALRLAALYRDGDGVSAIAALHASAAVPAPSVDDFLGDVARQADPAVAAHAAWALGSRRATPVAVTALGRLVVEGGFTAMVAERTLLRWAAPGAQRSASPRSTAVGPPTPDRGIVVLQPFLHAQLDRHGSQLGVGDSGGIASLLRSLGAVLPDTDDVDEVITITRRRDGESPCEALAPGHLVQRVVVGSGGPMPWRNGWRHRLQIQREFVAIGEALADRRVVWHLRMADVGTLVAFDVARRLGHSVVFTAAPDPHVVIDALQDSGRLDRSNFAVEDAAAQFWFRARLVERLTADADHLVLLPRPTIHRELVDLVGVNESDLRRRSTVVAEGIAVGEVDRATTRLATFGRSDAARRIVAAMPAERRTLPWLLTVGRLHPSKGCQRIVEAVAGDPALAGRVNIVIVGGDLVDPSPDERSTIERVRLAAAAAPAGLVTLVGHVPPSDVHDLMADVAAHNGVYVCGSDKEEFGLAIVEALAAGATVVAPERGGPRSYVAHGDTGVLCDTLSESALRSGITEALQLAGAPGRADRARAMVRSDLGVERMAAELGAVYRSLPGTVHRRDRATTAPSGGPPT